MTPDEAAAVLGVPRDADPASIDRAYRRLARELHPDRLAGASDLDVGAANARFIEVTAAHRVLIDAGPPRRGDVPAAPGSSTAGRPSGPRRRSPPRPLSPWLFATWAGLLVVGALLSSTTEPLLGPIAAWARLGLLVAAALATALSRRRWVWWTTLALLALNGVAVIAATTIPGLLGLGFMAVAAVGLAVQAGLVRFPDQD